jgi:hypothetical protein
MKLSSIHTILIVATIKGLHIHQLDKKNSFFYKHLQKPVYIEQPYRFINDNFSSYMCKLKKALYRLK